MLIVGVRLWICRLEGEGRSAPWEMGGCLELGWEMRVQGACSFLPAVQVSSQLLGAAGLWSSLSPPGASSRATSSKVVSVLLSAPPSRLDASFLLPRCSRYTSLSSNIIRERACLFAHEAAWPSQLWLLQGQLYIRPGSGSQEDCNNA